MEGGQSSTRLIVDSGVKDMRDKRLDLPVLGVEELE